MRTPYALAYVAAWSTMCLVALVLVVRERSAYAFAHRSYAKFLFVPWKVASFVLATTFFVAVAPYTNDPTWDFYDGALMSILTFLSAPWSIGALHRAMRGRVAKRQAFVAMCAWLFSASFSYDLYVFLRDKHYPRAFFSNMIASSVLYVSAGLFWNLVHR